MRQVPGVIRVSSCAEGEDDLSLLSVSQLKWNLNRRARIESRSHSAGKARTSHRGGSGKRPVAANEFGAITAHRSSRVVGIEESDARGKLRVVWILRQHGASGGGDLGGHMHDRFRPQI